MAKDDARDGAKDGAKDEAKAAERTISMPVGVVLRRTPGVTPWAKWAWRAVAVLPGAGPADWRELRREGDAVELHAGTRKMTLHRTDTEAYLTALSTEPPAVYVVMRAAEAGPRPIELVAVTASPFEAQDYADSGEDMVEPVPMPPGLIAWVREFCGRHHVDEHFVKRRRKRWTEDRIEDGVGDARIRQDADVYRAPGAVKRSLR